jgi:hypothetical protein
VAVPHDRGLALVGDADGGEVAEVEVGLGQRLPDDEPGVVADLLRVVLDPPGLREDLLVLLLPDRDDRAGVIEDDRPRAGRALVDGEDVLGHGRESFQNTTWESRPAMTPPRSGPTTGTHA